MIVLAVENEYIKERLDELYKQEIYSHDITYMEGVIEYLSKNRDKGIKTILITKDNLNGNLTKEMYIKQIRLANEFVKVILLTENLDEQYKKFLFANEIFNVIEGKEIEISNIIESIESTDKVIYKHSKEERKSKLEEPIQENGSTVISKQFISVFGTSGSGKSYVAGLLAKIFSNRLKIKVSFLDMDIQNPSMDIYNNLVGSGNILSRIVDDIDRRRDIKNSIDKNMFNDERNKNLWFMTNNTSIFECQNKLNREYYDKIYTANINKFDYVVVDLPSSPFIDVVKYTLCNSSTIFFVVNPNYISMRQGIKYLELMTKSWEISRENIFVIINKKCKNSLDALQISNLLSEYKIVSEINFDINVEGYINGAISNMYTNLDEEKIINSLGVDYVYNCSKRNSKKLISIFIKKEGKVKNDNKSIQSS